MAATKEFLALCEQLDKRGLKFSRELGVRVARGYADLGAEEFILLGSGKAVSVFTGKPTEISPDHEAFFFRVPSVDEMAAVLIERGAQVDSLKSEGSRWQLVVSFAAQKHTLVEHSLENLLAQALLLTLPMVDHTARPEPKLRVARV